MEVGQHSQYQSDHWNNYRQGLLLVYCLINMEYRVSVYEDALVITAPGEGMADLREIWVIPPEPSIHPFECQRLGYHKRNQSPHPARAGTGGWQSPRETITLFGFGI